RALGDFRWLTLVQKRGLDRVFIQYDNLEVVKIIQESQPINSSSASVRRILQILHSIEYWRIKHVPREENRVADLLTKMTSDKDHKVQLFEEAPGSLTFIGI
ncbi:hypothetical protein Gogos_004957, partial [Gossypium gossypioides]|nr:hypothetical protein [Gossypium gossypioides]